MVFEFSWDKRHDVLFGSMVSYLLYKRLRYCMIFNNYNFFVIVQVVMAQNALSLKMFVSNVNFKTELCF